MDKEVARRRQLCESADTAEWEGIVSLARDFPAPQKAFLKDHPPGLVGALLFRPMSRLFSDGEPSSMRRL